MSRKNKHDVDGAMDGDIDLVPMIDCIFLILMFFMLAGRIALDQRNQMITVPPTKTARNSSEQDKDYRRIIVNVFGNTQRKIGSTEPSNRIKVGEMTFDTKGDDNYEGYVKFRQFLDEEYIKADKKPDLKNPKLMIPNVILEIRADGQTEYRVVQEIQQVATDTINPSDKMKPKTTKFENMRPFVYIDFTTRPPMN